MFGADELGFNNYQPIDIAQQSGINPDPLSKYWLINIPSDGIDGITNVSREAVDRVLWGQMTEAINFRSLPGLMISYAPLPGAEDEYRTQVFGKESRPEWISFQQDISTLSIHSVVPPLDIAILSNSGLVELIRTKISEARALGREPMLFGYSQTPAMEKLAGVLDIPYMGNSEFALTAGSKIGLQQFLAKYSLPKLHTLPVYTLEDIRSGLSTLASMRYTDAVFKVNFSAGGVGHKLINIAESLNYIADNSSTPDSAVFGHLIPKEYFPGEGLILQGWIQKDQQRALASVDIMVLPNGEAEITHMKTKLNIGASNPNPASGYVPMDNLLFSQALPVAQKLKQAYLKEGATGAHCANLIYLKQEACDLYGFDYEVPIVHDENSRIGAGYISWCWVRALYAGQPGIGWVDKVIRTKPGLTTAEAIKILRENDLLIEKAGSTVNGVFLYDGIKLDSGLQQCNLIAISNTNNPIEAGKILTQAEILLSGN